MLAFNNSAYITQRPDLDAFGNEITPTWSQQIGAPIYAGTYPLSATVKVTDAKGLTQTITCPASLISSYTTSGGGGGGGGGGWGGGGGGCPTPDVLVTLADGIQKPAGDIVVGDKVWTQPEIGGNYGTFTVTAVEPDINIVWELVLADGRRLTFSGNHRFMTSDGWTELWTLTTGTMLYGTQPGEVLSISEIGVLPVVKITVGEAHTYETSGLLSHNIKVISKAI
jgi:hypothetical protein